MQIVRLDTRPWYVRLLRRLMPYAIVSVCVSVLTVYVAYTVAETSIVYVSNTTQECVEVYSTTPSYNCDNLPPKYIHRWVR